MECAVLRMYLQFRYRLSAVDRVNARKVEAQKIKDETRRTEDEETKVNEEMQTGSSCEGCLHEYRHS